MRLPLTLLFIFLYSNSTLSWAQTTTIVGKVYDGKTNETLPFVNVVFKGTSIGTTTDIDGNYTLTSSTPTDSIQVSFVGYKTYKRKIIKDKNQTLNIVLEINSVALKEIIIKPGENPAHRYLREIWKHKPDNDKDRYACYKYEAYNKLEFDINNLNDRFKKNKLIRPFDFAFNNMDSSNVNEKPFLPVFITESLSDIYYRKSPYAKKEVIKASKTAGFQNESVSAVLGDMYQNVNIYDNNIIVFGKNFVSPISTAGLFFYRYYLVDSMSIDNKWTYQIKFVPKRKAELTFDGNFWVHDTTFAIKRFEARISEGANINFVNNFYVIQEFDHIDNKNWMLKKDKLVVDFTYQHKAPGVYGRKTTTYKNFKLNELESEVFYQKIDDITVNKNALLITDDEWKELRHDTLSKNEKSVYKLIDTIQTLPVYRTYESIMQLFFTGYKSFKAFPYFEFGPIFSTYSSNKIEGNRFRLGGRTTAKFSHHVELNGYVAYGLFDQKFKYGSGFKWHPKKAEKWQVLNAIYKDDNEILGQNNLFRTDNLFVSLLRRRPLTDLTRVQQYKITYDLEPIKGVLTRTGINHRVIIPIGTTAFSFYKNDSTIDTKTSIKQTEATFYVRLAYKERTLNADFSRAYLGTTYPVIQLQYNAGIKGVLYGEYSYHKFVVNVEDRLRLQPLGYTDYILEYGKIWGKGLAYPLLELHPGNESFAYATNAFTLMNYFEFVSDEYVSANISHHFDGLFFNKVPLFKKLKWREVVSGKAVAGRLSDENIKEVILPAKTGTLSFTKPYAEASVGIENIFKFFRVEAIWRLTYLQNPNTVPFGVRATAQFIF